ncbi:MAG: LAGLIDADG family homing endonuclease [Mycobacterium sp.]|nr:LAGLIDADG family homing endonuclease [Mycobacterium sp.]
MRTTEEFESVRRLVAAGMNDCAIARTTGIPRPTVRGWRTTGHRSQRPAAAAPCGVIHRFDNFPARPYSYLLGMYLGDGCISRVGRSQSLRVALDRKYPHVVGACRQAIDMLMSGQPARAYSVGSGCTVVCKYSKHWPCLFPQHGPGRKHDRPIHLQPWQQALVKQATEDFIRGLIDSDGCRVVANDRGVASVRYHFTNHSEDILGLFTGALDDLGIPWTRNSRHMIAVYRKAATARLDEFVGPKTAPRPDLAADPGFPLNRS